MDNLKFILAAGSILVGVVIAFNDIRNDLDDAISNVKQVRSSMVEEIKSDIDRNETHIREMEFRLSKLE